MNQLKIRTASIILFILFQYTITVFSQCVQGDCNDGVGYYIYSNKDFYVGFFSNGIRQGAGFYYQAETDKYGEVYEAAFWNQGTAANSQALIISRGGSSIGNTDANGTITKGVYIDNSLQVFIVYAAGKLPADAEDCLYGDCQGGYGVFKFADSKGIDHFYVGNFKNGKFNGKGIEVVLENSSVLIGEFENDGNKKGINYLFDGQTANYYVGSILTEEFKFDYPEYIAPRVSAPTQSSAATKPVTTEKKKRGWGSFLGQVGGALVLVGAAVLVNELSNDSHPKNNATAKTNTGQANTANSTGNSSVRNKAQTNCSYCFHAFLASNCFAITNIFKCPSNPSSPYVPPYYVFGTRESAESARKQMIEDHQNYKRCYTDRGDNCN